MESSKYEKLGKYWPYFTWKRAITNAYLFQVSANSNVFYTCRAPIKSINNMNAVPTDQIVDIHHFNNKVFKKLRKS